MHSTGLLGSASTEAFPLPLLVSCRSCCVLRLTTGIRLHLMGTPAAAAAAAAAVAVAEAASEAAAITTIGNDHEAASAVFVFHVTSFGSEAR